MPSKPHEAAGRIVPASQEARGYEVRYEARKTGKSSAAVKQTTKKRWSEP
jgi:hypothetical protein